MNLSTVAKSVWNVTRQPNLLLPHAIYDSFDQLPVPISRAFSHQDGEKDVDVRALILDKDNCFARAGSDTVHSLNQQVFQRLIDYYSPENILIVSNSSGFAASDPDGRKAAALEEATKVKVLRHTLRKPACGTEALAYFKNTITSPSQVCVVGDRLFTDILMGNLIHSRAVWIRRGVDVDRGALTKVESSLFNMLSRWRLQAPAV